MSPAVIAVIIFVLALFVAFSFISFNPKEVNNKE